MCLVISHREMFQLRPRGSGEIRYTKLSVGPTRRWRIPTKADGSPKDRGTCGGRKKLKTIRVSTFAAAASWHSHA